MGGTLEVLGTTTLHDECIVNSRVRFACSNDDWCVFAQSNVENLNYSDLVFESANMTRVTFTDDFEAGTFNFTGSHRCTFSYNQERTKDLLGKIVVATGEYNNLDNLPDISLDEAVPVVELGEGRNNKRVFGVIAGFEESSCLNRYFKIGNIRFNKGKSLEDTKIIVNSIGEGAIKVCDFNGNFENGDLITTGLLEGYGVKQADDLVHNYTVAKVTTDVDWNDPNMEKRFVTGTQMYLNKLVRWALVGCIYLC